MANPACLLVVDASFVIVIEVSANDVTVRTITEHFLSEVAQAFAVAVILDDVSSVFEYAKNLLETVV